MGWGVAAGLVLGYFGVRSLCNWLVERTFSDKPDNNVHMVGHFTKEVRVFGCENNPTRWSELDKPVQCRTFDFIPISYRVVKWTGPLINLQTTNGPFTCMLEPDVDVRLNTCVLTQVHAHVKNDFNGTLNYPTQLEIRLLPSTEIVVYGRVVGTTFHISKLSNYPVNEYKAVLVSKKMRKAGFILLGIAFIGSAILFRQFKE